MIVIRNENESGELKTTLRSPIALELVDVNGNVKWLDGTYKQVSSASDHLTCLGEIVTESKSRFVFEDRYTPHNDTGSFRLKRIVRVEEPSAQDVAFMSRFSIPVVLESQLVHTECFVPGIWYFNNKNLPPTALASDSTDEVFLFREDRLPLPLVMFRQSTSGATFALTHSKPDGATFAEEDGLERIVDRRMQFGSLGLYSSPAPSLAFVFPGTEGAKTYVSGPSQQKRWAFRSHPVKSDVQHMYELILRVSKTPNYAQAVTETWREGFEEFAPPNQPVDLAKVYANGVSVLNKYTTEYNGVPGLPFSVNVPDGSVKDVSFQMGFVGQQIASAHHLINFGFESGRRGFALKGEEIVDWWVWKSSAKNGLPRTWFDLNPNRWRDYKTFLRIASDGMVGVLQAWNVMERNGYRKPEWLDYCEAFGNWLVVNQNPDGSFYRQYDFDGQPVQRTKFNSTHPVRFLVDLYAVTKNQKYLDTAIRAGDFSRENIHKGFRYVGGTPDNPDVIDKEAGLIALEAFLALYDVTKEKTWLDCAVQAATFSETWMYCWNVPMPVGDTASFFPRGRSTVGMSIISTGHSGADTFMSYYAFQFYRLFIYSGDAHFLNVSKTLQCGTRQLGDDDGSLHYAHSGLQTEAMTIALPRGHGVKLWLPWLTVSAIDPLVQLKNAFGSFRIEEIELLQLSKRRELNEGFGRTRGLSSKGPDAVFGDAVFLDEMRELESNVGHGVLGKKGSHGFGPVEVAVKGVKAKHALSLHPPRNGTAHVVYSLRQQYSQFTGDVAISDAGATPSESPLTFKILGDGKELWKSKPLRERGESQSFSVAIQRVQEMKLVVDCPSGNGFAYAVWINPLVSK